MTSLQSVPTCIPLRSLNANFTLFVRSVKHSAILKTFHSIADRTSASLHGGRNRLIFKFIRQPSPTNHAGYGIRRYASLSRNPKTPRSIRTLDHHRLSPSDFLDVSGVHYIEVAIATTATGTIDTKTAFQYLQQNIQVNNKPVRLNVRFPDDARGFLYLHRLSSPANPLASEIRFRKTQSSDPSTFDIGQDLCLPNGLPWSMSLLSAQSSTRYKALIDLLIRDGLISPQNLSQKPDVREDTGTEKPRRLSRRSIVLSHLDQPIPVKLGGTTDFWIIINKDKVERGRLEHLDSRFNQVRHRKLRGTVLCRFEMSSRPEHKGTRTLVLRVLSIMEKPERVDPKSDTYLPIPVIGELLPHVWRVNEVWCCDVDDCSRHMKPLRYLMNTRKRQKM